MHFRGGVVAKVFREHLIIGAPKGEHGADGNVLVRNAAIALQPQEGRQRVGGGCAERLQIGDASQRAAQTSVQILEVGARVDDLELGEQCQHIVVDFRFKAGRHGVQLGGKLDFVGRRDAADEFAGALTGDLRDFPVVLTRIARFISFRKRLIALRPDLSADGAGEEDEIGVVILCVQIILEGV